MAVPKILRGGANGPGAIGLLVYASGVRNLYQLTRQLASVTVLVAIVGLLGSPLLAGWFTAGWAWLLFGCWAIPATASVLLGVMPLPPAPATARDEWDQ